jgi:tetratricopeptide (TPR) repeat protein
MVRQIRQGKLMPLKLSKKPASVAALERNRPILLLALLFTALITVTAIGISYLAGHAQKANWGRLPETGVAGRMPKEYTEIEFARALSKKLTPDEVNLAVNPLTITPEIKHWAFTLTSSVSNDTARAKLLFEALVDHLQKSEPPTIGAVRTAREVFAAWETPGTSLYCKDYALLYVALARAVGIKAYDVYVTEEVDGQSGPHDCAAVVLEGKVVLVDPTWSLFGAKHKNFTLLDDVQATGLYMSQLPDFKSSEIGCKLAPTLGLVQLNLFEKLANNNRVREAAAVMSDVKRLITNDATTGNYVEAKVALLQGNPDLAVLLLSNAIGVSPNEATYHTCLAEAFAQQGRIAEATKEFQRALQCPVTDNEAAFMNFYTRNTNELAAWGLCKRGIGMQNQGNLNASLSNFDKAMEAKPDYAMAYVCRATLKRLKGDEDGAVADYNQAIKLKPEVFKELSAPQAGAK